MLEKKNKMELPEYDDSGQTTLEPYAPLTVFSKTLEKVVDVQANVWNITEFSKLPEKLHSPEFTCGGATWYIA